MVGGCTNSRRKECYQEARQSQVPEATASLWMTRSALGVEEWAPAASVERASNTLFPMKWKNAVLAPSL